MSDQGLFQPSLTTAPMAAAVSDAAWLAALLRFETELASVQAELGLIPDASAHAIAAACQGLDVTTGELGQAGRRSANPVVPLVKALQRRAGPGADHVHLGATSQDALDTATMLVAGQALAVLDHDLTGLAALCAELAMTHRGTVMAGRTLLQQAVPITFGLKAAGWLTALVDTRAAIRHYQRTRLAVQFGGAAGNISVLGALGLEVSNALAARLGLAAPVLPWHGDRTRIVELGALLAAAAGAAGKIALDVILLSQTEVGEVAEAAPGGSSAMPHKQNPVAAIEADACVRLLLGQVQVLMGAQRVEHERAAGAWQAEWSAVTNALLLCAGAIARTTESLQGLRVDAERMVANLVAGGGLMMAESLTAALAEKAGRGRAREIVEQAAGRAAERKISFGAEVLADPAVTAQLTTAEIERALDPAANLGVTDQLIERALDHHRKEVP